MKKIKDDKPDDTNCDKTKKLNVIWMVKLKKIFFAMWSKVQHISLLFIYNLSSKTHANELKI